MHGERSRSDASRPPRQCRCTCGSLLARLVGGSVELKCRRCKRTLLLPVSGDTRPALARRASSSTLETAG
jgi:hypothetical protein